MVQWLGVLAVLTENLGSVPSTHISQLSRFMESNTLFMGTSTYMAYVHTDIYTYKNNI